MNDDVDHGPFGEQERAMIAFERQWWKHQGLKEQAIVDMFGVSPMRYLQRLNRLIDHPEAYVFDAVTVKRLRRLRAERLLARDTPVGRGRRGALVMDTRKRPSAPKG